MEKIAAVAIFALLLLGCNKEKRTLKRLDNTRWDIVKSERWIIYNGGTTDQFEDLDNAGTVTIATDPWGSDGVKELTMNYTNFQGATASFTRLIYIDEAAERLSINGALCNNVFECDLVFNIEVNQKNKQVWTAFGTDDTFVYPASYNANQDFHVKWQLTLEKTENF